MRKIPEKPFKRPHPIRNKKMSDSGLQKANLLFNQREFEKSGLIYLELAINAEKNDSPVTADFFVRVALCQINLNKDDESINTIFYSFNWLLTRKRYRKIKSLSESLNKKLIVIEKKLLGTKIDEWISQNIPSEIRSSEIWNYPKKALVVKASNLSLCSSCGKSRLNLSEIEWFDKNTPMCSYCGCILEMNSK